MKSFEKSKAAFNKAEPLMPGGVNSPVRAYKGVKHDPVYMERGEGARIFDLDGNEYIDYVLSWGPLILGHADSHVVEQLKAVTEKGTSFGASHEMEIKLAELVIERVPSIEVVRMVTQAQKQQ